MIENDLPVRSVSSTPGPPASFAYPPAPPADLKPIPRWVWISVAAFLIVLTVLAVPVYRSIRTQSHLASSAVNTLHADMTRRKDAMIFDQSDAAYQQDVGRKKSDELFDWVYSSLGDPHDATLVGTYASANAKTGEILTLTYKTNFDKGVATETIKLHKVGDRYLLIAYTVQSPQLKQEDVPTDLRSN